MQAPNKYTNYSTRVARKCTKLYKANFSAGFILFANVSGEFMR